jgi:hypothetical protein
MAVFGRHDDLLRQIPDDVKERTAKAGVTDIDWYAGRLTSSDSRGFSEVPPDRHAELREKARVRRRAERDQRVSDVITKISGLASRLRPRLRRAPARPTP